MSVHLYPFLSPIMKLVSLVQIKNSEHNIFGEICTHKNYHRFTHIATSSDCSWVTLYLPFKVIYGGLRLFSDV